MRGCRSWSYWAHFEPRRDPYLPGSTTLSEPSRPDALSTLDIRTFLGPERSIAPQMVAAGSHPPDEWPRVDEAIGSLEHPARIGQLHITHESIFPHLWSESCQKGGYETPATHLSPRRVHQYRQSKLADACHVIAVARFECIVNVLSEPEATTEVALDVLGSPGSSVIPWPGQAGVPNHPDCPLDVEHNVLRRRGR